MQFSIKNNNIFFRDFDLSKYMNIKEISINCEENEAFVIAEFKSDIDFKISGFLSVLLENMSEDNLIELKSEVDFRMQGL